MRFSRILSVLTSVMLVAGMCPALAFAEEVATEAILAVEAEDQETPEGLMTGPEPGADSVESESPVGSDQADAGEGAGQKEAVSQAVMVPAADDSSALLATAEASASDFTFATDDNGNATITGYTGSATDVSIPSKANGHSVTSIGSSAFRDCESLESVEIPEGVTSIGPCAFYGCSSLVSVEVPEGVVSIDFAVFSGCESLESVILPSTLKGIGSDAFSGCESLESVILPSALESIGDDVFKNCSSLVSVYAPTKAVYDLARRPGASVSAYDLKGAYIDAASGVRYFTDGDGAVALGFEPGCSALPITLGDLPVVGLAPYAFFRCSSLASIEIPEGVTSIGAYAFCECSSLASVEIPEGVTSIDDDAFYGCSSLVSVELPDSLTKIGKFAFSLCYSLESAYIPASAWFSTTSFPFNNCPNTVFYAANDFVCDRLVEAGVAKEKVFVVSTDDFEVAVSDCVYTGSPCEPEVVVFSGSTQLVEGADYTVSYSSNLNAGKGTAKIKGRGVYRGEKDVEFEIEPADIADVSHAVIPAQSYTGFALEPEVDLAFGGLALEEGEDYELSYESNVEIGEAVAVASGKGNYKGQLTSSFNIKPAILKVSNVVLPYTSAAYTGLTKKPTVVVKVNGVKQPASDYEVTYWNKAKTKKVAPRLVDTYWIRVKAKSAANTTGTAWKKLVINPKATANLKLTKLNNGLKASWTKRTVQVSGYQVAYKQVGTSTWKTRTVTSYKTNVKSVTGLKDKKSYQVRVRTYKTVGGVKYYSAWTGIKTVKTR